MYFIGGAYTLKLSAEKTRHYYAECQTGLCPCAACRNFVDAVKALSPEANALFAQLSVDPLKPTHLYMVGRSGWGKQCAYEAEYLVIGHILRDGAQNTAPDGGTKYLSYTDATISFDPPPRQGQSPPSFVMRATLLLPWVIREAEGAAL